MIKTFGIPALVGILIAIGLHAWLGFGLSDEAAFTLYFVCVAVVEILAVGVRRVSGTDKEKSASGQEKGT